MNEALRIVVVAPDLATADSTDADTPGQTERSRKLRIGLLESGFNLIATLPADMFLSNRLAPLQPDMIIVNAENDARDLLAHVVMATRDERRPIVLFTNDEDTRHVRDAVAAGGSPVAELRVDGGACVNDLLMQFQADLLGIPVLRPQVTETTALGAAYLAGLAIGLFKNLDELSALWQVERRFYPTLPRERAQALMGEWAHAVRQATAA